MLDFSVGGVEIGKVLPQVAVAHVVADPPTKSL